MGWCRALFLLSMVCATTHSKSVTSENVRKSRQSGFGECCPCPKPGVLEEPLYVAPVDDCPCRNRATDADGASSILSPALQALRPLMRSEGPKTEPEPLLKPEVGLASSVLKTLQEVTNEEYEDALARDATRSVVKALESDFPLSQSEDTPGSIINIILNPKEAGNDLEVVPEASHLQETRCIHPLGSTHNNYERKNFKPSLFREPSKNLIIGGRKSNDFDMDNQASEIQNSLQKPSSGFIMKSLYEPEGSPRESEQSTIDEPNSFAKIPDLKLSTIVDNIKKSIHSNSILNKLTKKDMNTPISEDINYEPINTVTEEKPRKLGGTLKNLQNVFSRAEKPMHLKNLLKLKDVELIPKQKTVKHKSVENDDYAINASIADDDKIAQIEDNTHTEILDAIPSSSNRDTNAVFLKTQSTENNACEDIANVKIKEGTLNNAKNSKLQQETVNEIKNPSTDIILLPDESDEKAIETEMKHQITNQDGDISTEHHTSTLKDETLIEENQSVDDENQDKKVLPLIRADIIKSFKDFKKVNDDMQEKLKHNLQDVLKVVDTDKKKVIEVENLKPDTRNSEPEKKSNNSKSLTHDDLQRMSDSILNESNMNNKKLKPSLIQENAGSEIDNCIPTAKVNHQVVQENASNESLTDESDAQSYDSNLTDQLSDDSKNKNVFNLKKISSNENQFKQGNQEQTLETPSINSNFERSDEKTFNTNFDDSLESLNKVPKSSSIPQSTEDSTIDFSLRDSSAIQEESTGKDLKTENIKEKTSADGLSEPMKNNEKECLQSNSNDMNVQASEPIGNSVTFVRPDFNLAKPDRPFTLGSGFKPYSARLATPHSLHRDTLYPNLSDKVNSLQGTFKNNNLKNVFKNLETPTLPSLGKRQDTIISKPLDDFNSISYNFKTRTDESLKNLNNILGSGTGELKSNHLKNVLNNADDIRYSLSKAHSDLNNKLQQLHSDWTDKIHTIGQRADTPLPLNHVASPRKNIFNADKKIPLSGLEKPRSLLSFEKPESNIMKGKPKTLLNDEKFKLPRLLPKSLYKAPTLSERKATILTTTKRPLPVLTTRRPPRKEVTLKSAPKSSLTQTLKDAIESAKSDKINSKLRDMKTLPSNMRPLRVQNQDYSARKSIPETRESLENRGNVQPYNDVTTGNTNGNGFSRYSGMPFQLKAEEFSVLKKLLDGIRSSQLQSDTLRNNDDYEDNANENLQAPSQNIERIQVPENTLKENVSYKCKMVCTKDDK